jgi:rhamnosyltransferase
VPRDEQPPLTLTHVLAVVVCYHPDVKAVAKMALSLAAVPGVEVVLIDNTESDAACDALRGAVSNLRIDVLCSGVNRGLGAAHNIGIREARARGCQAVLLLDQDSVLDTKALIAMSRAYEMLTSRGERVAAVGPTFIDPRNGHCFPFVRLCGLRMQPVSDGLGLTVECDLLISSGSLIPLLAIDAVGELNADLFIDYVDIEWCIRAGALGWKVFGVTDALMTHELGDKTVAVFGRRIPVHSPQRQYYLVRNALLLARMPHVPMKWRLHLVYRVCAQLVLFGVFCAPRLRRAGWMIRGVWDALMGRGGRLHGPHTAHPEDSRAALSAESAAVDLPRAR